MPSQKLDAFFHQKLVHARQSDLNWEKRKQEWLAAIDTLYVEIERLLAEPIKSGAIRLHYREVSLTEEFLGTYTARELVLYVGDEMVVFSPKGRNVVGATGRVDIRGELGEATLIVQPGPRWGLVVQRIPSMRVVPLSEDSLLDALKGVMRP